MSAPAQLLSRLGAAQLPGHTTFSTYRDSSPVPPSMSANTVAWNVEPSEPVAVRCIVSCPLVPLRSSKEISCCRVPVYWTPSCVKEISRRMNTWRVSSPLGVAILRKKPLFSDVTSVSPCSPHTSRPNSPRVNSSGRSSNWPYKIVAPLPDPRSTISNDWPSALPAPATTIAAIIVPTTKSVVSRLRIASSFSFACALSPRTENPKGEGVLRS